MPPHTRRSLLAAMLGLCSALAQPSPAAAEAWPAELRRQVAQIDAETPGALGVFVKRLSDGTSLAYHADRPWYLASTTKVPVAVAVLQKVETGKLSLDRTLVLRASDYVDGAGDLLWHEPGARFSVRTLLEKMITRSDSTAADMLIRLLGTEELDRRVQQDMVASGFGPITTILQVRYDAYGELHPRVKALSNMDFIRLKKAGAGEARLEALLAKLPVGAQALQAPSIAGAFERYYQRGANSASLRAYGQLLERLVEGELLSPEHTALLLGFMERIRTGDDRIKAGLPDHLRFAQKTGTQVRRMCNVGIVRPKNAAKAQDAVVVAACAEKFSNHARTEAAFRRLGAALDDVGLL